MAEPPVPIPDPAFARPAPVIDLFAPALYANRELSWLDFNDRVLAEAYDERNPLLERIRFLAITSSNLDEFYSKRLGWLQTVIQSDPMQLTVDGLTAIEQRQLVRERGAAMRAAIDSCWTEELAPRLAAYGFRIVRMDELGPAERERIDEYFQRSIFPVLTPLVVDPAHPFPFISGGSLSLVMNVHLPGSSQFRFARVKVPENRPRFVEAGEGQLLRIEDLIAAHFDMLFPGAVVAQWRLMRVLRSAEMGASGEEADDLLEVIEYGLERRRLADAVSLELTGPLPAARLELLLDELHLTEDDVLITEHTLDKADLFEIAALPVPGESFPPFTPPVPSAFRSVDADATLFQVLAQRDVLVHHPYESFDGTIVRFIEEASADRNVLAIKHTTYRTNPDSPILEALIRAARRGKQVAVLVELTARFDEANNIEWARKLEDAGVHVAYGNPAEKIHGKIALVVREEALGVRMYAHIGTGNYHSRSARVYTDLGLFTSDEGICLDLLRVFNHLTGFGHRLETEHLPVAPVNLRHELEWRVRREIDAARAGRPARVIFKMNALEDPAFCRLLYQASAAGVAVDLIVRGICRLRPGVPGLSERIRVQSVIGRFLEHSRIYCFENDGDREYFIGSADVMKRNLDERIEVLAPIRDPEHRRHLREVLDMLLADERQTWTLHDRTWTHRATNQSKGVQQRLLELAPFS